MPYFVFRVSADMVVTPVNSFSSFREAKELCRSLRMAQPAGDKEQIRMTFAATEQEARRLIAEKRQISSPLEEWES